MILLPPKPFVLLEDSRPNAPSPAGRLFQNPREILRAETLDQVLPVLRKIEAANNTGLLAAGFMSYEAAAAFHSKLPFQAPPAGQHLCWFGLFETQVLLAPSDLDAFWAEKVRQAPIHTQARVKDHLGAEEYTARAKTVADYLEAGDIYQANFTFPVQLDCSGHAEAIYSQLRRSQPSAYSAFINCGDVAVLSTSPELFFRSDEQGITAKPMKGTAQRPERDEDVSAAAQVLQEDPKNRAENLMITDLLRNDLSRVARAGSVNTGNLFEVEALSTVLQMTSRVTAQLRPDVGLSELMTSLFPCGSITGAPKLRAMEIIQELEDTPRGVYCGAIGYSAAADDACFSVPIRTVIATPTGATLCVGSGLVADSAAKAEYAESLLKARFLEAECPEFGLIETMGWLGDGKPRYLDLHLARLENSRLALGFKAPEQPIAAHIEKILSDLPNKPHRLRLLLGKHGTVSISAKPLKERKPDPWTVAIATLEPNIPARFLAHKTTHRWFYQKALKDAQAAGVCDEVLLIDKDGALLEGSFTNIFVRRSGTLYTPRWNGRFLRGVLRSTMLSAGKCKEADLKVEDLDTADAVFVGNALRGLIRVNVQAD